MKISRIVAILLAAGALLALFAVHAGRSPNDTDVASIPDAEESVKPAPAPDVPQKAEIGANYEYVRRATSLLIDDLNIVAHLDDATPQETVRADALIMAANREFFLTGAEISRQLAESAATGPGGFACTDTVFQGTVGKGETISQILENAADGAVGHYLKAAAKVFSFRAFREGQPYIVVTDGESGKVKRFEYEINDSRRLVVEGDDAPQARLEPIEYTTLLETAEGAIDDNLFQAVADIGENPQLAFKLVNLFGSEINFLRDLREGASFSVLVEKRYRKGEYRGYGRILAARFINDGKTYEAFLFRDGSGKPAYYNANGENLHKTLLQSPLSVTRLTSRFSHSRKHPILGLSRPHLGVDYGAPTGTPVKAVGDGIVTKRGWGGGYGNQIILRHSGGLESLYAHLSGFARGLREGQKVSQGQVIGFVGSTGLSTGPHLDFRLRQDGKFVDPTKAINPRSLPVSKNMMSEFRKTRDLEKACLDGEKKLENYTVDSIVPLPQLFAEDKNTGKRNIKAKRKTGRRAPPPPARAKHRLGKRR